ncbi:MAG: hypothetical protein KatS3mg121_0678 [Gammaproteobacteria bacterium]|nr:MAG: hypothetical protein KatS3mg121_0678 [Gammaproteobacteria bacterium]
MRCATVVLAALALAACGGGGGASDPSSGSSSSASSSSSPSSSSSSSSSSAGSGGTVPLATCQALVEDAGLNWRDAGLSDQEVVECLWRTLGEPVGFGEGTTGGYDPNGSRLVVVSAGPGAQAEQRILEAIGSPEPTWIVFDKANPPRDIAMYRLWCSDAAVRAALGGASVEQCLDHRAWCAANGIGDEAACKHEFFNVRLNDGALPIRNPMIDSHTTLDGRGVSTRVLFSGFAIGADSNGASTHVSENVIVTNLYFEGAGHVEDHELDPDMLRTTGESHRVWIHQNTFDTTGDSAFDAKVGAYGITISFNRVHNVKRATLHGSSDSRTINEQITTTMHNNLFVTTDDAYSLLGNTLRRVPLIRRGQSHMFNNVFYGYRKDLLSVRVGGRVLFEDNMFLNRADNSEGDDIDYWVENLLRDFREGGLEIRGSHVWYATPECRPYGSPGDLTASYGSTPDMLAQYSAATRARIEQNRFVVGPELVEYVLATAGKGGRPPYVSPISPGRDALIAQAPATCQ